MALRLILMRHAKSSWGDPLCDDFDRVLNTRGRRNAGTMGHWLAQHGYVPDEVMASSAARTRETAQLVCAALPDVPTPTFHDGLYHAGRETILKHLHRGTGRTILLIAHNPGIGDFAEHFGRQPSDHPDFYRYPTCATAVFELSADVWKDARFGTNQVLDFTIPRDVEAAQ